MIKAVCDRCGKEDLSFYKLSTYKVIVKNGILTTEYDLCRECLIKVRDFIVNNQPEQIDCPWK